MRLSPTAAATAAKGNCQHSPPSDRSPTRYARNGEVAAIPVCSYRPDRCVGAGPVGRFLATKFLGPAVPAPSPAWVQASMRGG